MGEWVVGRVGCAGMGGGRHGRGKRRQGGVEGARKGGTGLVEGGFGEGPRTGHLRRLRARGGGRVGVRQGPEQGRGASCTERRHGGRESGRVGAAPWGEARGEAGRRGAKRQAGRPRGRGGGGGGKSLREPEKWAERAPSQPLSSSEPRRPAGFGRMRGRRLRVRFRIRAPRRRQRLPARGPAVSSCAAVALLCQSTPPSARQHAQKRRTTDAAAGLRRVRWPFPRRASLACGSS